MGYDVKKQLVGSENRKKLMEIEESPESRYSRSSKNLAVAGKRSLEQNKVQVALKPETQTSAFELFKKPHRFGHQVESNYSSYGS